jgi:hypothetical protein
LSAHACWCSPAYGSSSLTGRVRLRRAGKRGRRRAGARRDRRPGYAFAVPGREWHSRLREGCCGS